MKEITRTRIIRPSSRKTNSKNYKIDTINISSGDVLIVKIHHESKSFFKEFKFSGNDLKHRKSIHFRVK